MKILNNDFVLYLNHGYEEIIHYEYYIKAINISNRPLKIVGVLTKSNSKDTSKFKNYSMDTFYIKPNYFEFIIIRKEKSLNFNLNDTILSPSEIKLRYIINDSVTRLKTFKVQISSCYHVIPESKSIVTRVKHCNDTINNLPIRKYKYDKE